MVLEVDLIFRVVLFHQEKAFDHIGQLEAILDKKTNWYMLFNNYAECRLWKNAAILNHSKTFKSLSRSRTMRIAKTEVPVKVDAPGAVARQITNFGDATDYGKMDCVYLKVAGGTDFTPLLKGLEDDLCHSPHWGYLIKGRVTITYQDGSTETTSTGDLFYWPPKHTALIEEDSEVIMFSPQQEHCEVFDHFNQKLGAS